MIFLSGKTFLSTMEILEKRIDHNSGKKSAGNMKNIFHHMKIEENVIEEIKATSLNLIRGKEKEKENKRSWQQ